MRPVIHSLAPTGHTGGRVYLRMLQQLTRERITWQNVPDFKRSDPDRRWRTMRHLAARALTRASATSPTISSTYATTRRWRRLADRDRRDRRRLSLFD